MGKIATCNATNDLFALNATSVLSYSCFLGLPTDIPEDTSVNILKGIKDFLGDMGAKINGGHTIQNEAPLIGGAASALLKKEHMIPKQGVKSGDHLIITKPLGIQTIMAADRTLKGDASYLEGFDMAKIEKAVKMTEEIMTTSNLPIPKLIHSHGMFDAVHAMTDVTGFGFKRHLEEMLVNSGCGARIDLLPAIYYAPVLEDLFCYGIDEGESSEIAGAMLMSLSDRDFKDFTRKMDDENIWWMEVGAIAPNITGVKYSESFNIVEVEKYS